MAVADDIKDAPVAARLLDVELVVFKSEGHIVVARDLCPHRGMALSRGWISDGQIVCPCHGLHFNAQGRCNAIPADPDAVLPDRMALTLLPSIERLGLIWTSLAKTDSDLPSQTRRP